MTLDLKEKGGRTDFKVVFGGVFGGVLVVYRDVLFRRGREVSELRYHCLRGVTMARIKGNTHGGKTGEHSDSASGS